MLIGGFFQKKAVEDHLDNDMQHIVSNVGKTAGMSSHSLCAFQADLAIESVSKAVQEQIKASKSMIQKSEAILGSLHSGPSLEG